MPDPKPEAPEQDPGQATEQEPVDPGRHFLMGGQLSGDPTGEQRSDALRASVEGDPTQQPEAETPAPQEEEAPGEEPDKAETDEEQEEKLLAGKFKSVEELEEAFRHQESTIGRQGSELGELRQAVARIEARQAVERESRDNRESQQQQVSEQERLLSVLAKDAEDNLGLTEDEAEAYATRMFRLMDRVADNRVKQAAARYEPILQSAHQHQRTQKIADHLRQETGPDGQPIRPDWNEVVTSPEFEAMYQEEPEILESPTAMKLAYETAKLLKDDSTGRESEKAEEARSQANAIVQQEKDRAAAGAGGGGSPPVEQKSDDPEWDRVRSAGHKDHFLMGGGP